jgi:ABC-type multidrug transport system fused ATPase/permease subunit
MRAVCTPTATQSLAVVTQVGIVGRTGSGKSSTIMALTRLYPAIASATDQETVAAPVSIDGVDISRLSLGTLRGGATQLPPS